MLHHLHLFPFIHLLSSPYSVLTSFGINTMTMLYRPTLLLTARLWYGNR